jgi:hypothetical protein
MKQGNVQLLPGEWSVGVEMDHLTGPFLPIRLSGEIRGIGLRKVTFFWKLEKTAVPLAPLDHLVRGFYTGGAKNAADFVVSPA